MKQMKRKKERGITLIALVVTIIVLIVLAGISINLMFGANGIINRAKQSKTLTDQASINEQKALGELDEQLEKYLEGLPENTKDTKPGTIVKLKEEWKGKNKNTVYAVAIGDGEEVPVPGNGIDEGFYYVGGNLNTGVIISDNLADKYDGKIDKTTYEYTTSLQGNQFVWIPCEESNYKKCNVWNGTTQTNGTLANTEWDTTTPEDEKIQIKKYGGFYVGRYEAGLASTITEFITNQPHTESNQVYNKNGIPQSKAGVIPWMFIDWTHAKANAESMYNNDYVNSGLITGTQWDVILNTMIAKKYPIKRGEENGTMLESDMTNSQYWGNYKNTSITYNGRKTTAYVNKYWTLPPLGNTSSGRTSTYTDNQGDLLTTGASDETQKYHTFDIAGNLWEWTEEGASTNRVPRGGSYISDSSIYPACYRGSGNEEYIGLDLGFRPVLYIK